MSLDLARSAVWEIVDRLAHEGYDEVIADAPSHDTSRQEGGWRSIAVTNTRGGTCSECAGVRGSDTFKGSIDFGDFDEFLRKVTLFKEVPVERPTLDVGLVERWFQCAKCKVVWRLVEPDPPFTGTWEPVA